MNILLTGGTGYIGSHVALSLIEQGHEPVLYDNLDNSKLDVVTRLESIAKKSLTFIHDNILNTDKLIETLDKFKIDAVLHFAGLKSVSESVVHPYKYYINNLEGTRSLLQAMENVYGPKTNKTLVFSSSATVYGHPCYLPLDENHPTNPTNTYGNTKLAVEHMLQDVKASNSAWRIACLRYFNPIGSHPSGIIGDESNGIPNNLVPNIVQVANGTQPFLKVFGNNYNTADGSGVRDYIHINDLASGHLASLDYLCKAPTPVIEKFNLGTGCGNSVFELIKCFEKITKLKIPYKIENPRSGDVDISFAKVEKANKILNWHATHTLDDALNSVWEWQKKIAR